MIHVYAFTEHLGDIPEIHGLAGARIERLSVDEVDAVFSRAAGPPSSETARSDALAHGAVVEALRECAAAVVPVRFGELLPDDAALTVSLRERLASMRDNFNRVRDCVEIGVRVYDGETGLERCATGTDYMRRRAWFESQRREAVEDLDRSLGRLARDTRTRADATAVERERFAGAYLVVNEQVDAVRAVVDAFAAKHDDLTVVCTGPWAPFSFVERAA
jgi:Gas vesicle synthesis protein GvpL/GvpF